jgi:hypothetical protein
LSHLDQLKNYPIGYQTDERAFRYRQSPSRDAAAVRSRRGRGRAVGFDLAQWWTPTARGYFSRVSKQQMTEAVTEGKSDQAAENIAKLKKAEMAERSEALLADTGWLPPVLR